MKKICIFCLSLLTAMTAMAEEWTLVTDPATLQAGDLVVLACNTEGVTAGEYNSTKGYFASVASIFGDKNSTITSLGNGSVVLTIGGQAGAWTFTLDGQLIGASAPKKLLLGRGTTTWTISIIGGDATITNTNPDYGSIQYNKQHNSLRFLNYTSNQTPVQLYRMQAADKFSLTYQGFPYKRTLCEEPTYSAGTQVRLSSGTKQREDGLWISGWDYQGTFYAVGAEFTMPQADVELTPVWGEKPQTQGVETVQSSKADNAWTKIFRNGQLVIIRDGVEYNVLGGRIK